MYSPTVLYTQMNIRIDGKLNILNDPELIHRRVLLQHVDFSLQVNHHANLCYGSCTRSTHVVKWFNVEVGVTRHFPPDTPHPQYKL